MPSSPQEDPAEPLELPLGGDPGASLTMENRTSRPGIIFGAFGMTSEGLDNVHTGWMAAGKLDPSTFLNDLSAARAKGGRVFVKLSKGKDHYIKNADGTFSLSKWKSLVGRYKSVNFGQYIKDGTIIAHYLIDEPHRPERWGGNGISHKTLEEMARFSKELWPDLTTVVRVAPSWLAGASFQWTYVDAGWTQYRATHGDAARWVASETAAAEREGLGLVVGLNVHNGGDGSSGIRGYDRSKWAMSATEIRRYGAAMLGSSRACAFVYWTWDAGFYGRSDIRSAMAEVSSKAKAHVRTSCRQ